jgi:hypothetical protein
MQLDDELLHAAGAQKPGRERRSTPPDFVLYRLQR